MERTREVLRLAVAGLVVAAALVAGGGGVLPSAQAASGSTPTATTGTSGTGAPIDDDLQAKAEEGSVDVIAVTSAPGEQVADAVMAAVPDESVSAVDAGATSQLAVTVDAEGLDALRRAPYVERIVENGKNYVSADAWAENIGVPATHSAGWDGSGQTIAILDSGVQKDHPYLAGKVTAEACFSSGGAPGTATLCPGGGNTQFGSGSATPCLMAIIECEHGTHVAGIAAGGPVTTAGRTLQGVAPAASIVAVQIFTKGTTVDACSGPAPCVFAYDSDLNDALFWLRAQVQNNVAGFQNLAAVNLSLGGGLSPGACDDDPSKPYVDALAAIGVVTVAATGNLGFNSAAFPGISAPACISTVVSVGATTLASTLAGYSNLTRDTTILAPGGPIFSSKPGSAYGTLTGTSMAAPVVSGAIALLKQQGYTTKSTIMSRLITTADKVSTAFGLRPEVELDSALLGVPNSPRDPAALPGEGYVDVAWNPPTFLGDGPLAGYAVATSPASSGCFTSGATMCRVT
ncbi:MAG TPA: S8 family serine peptidase, partial [Acidimicrobiales bacterium]